METFYASPQISQLVQLLPTLFHLYSVRSDITIVLLRPPTVTIN